MLRNYLSIALCMCVALQSCDDEKKGETPEPQPQEEKKDSTDNKPNEQAEKIENNEKIDSTLQVVLRGYLESVPRNYAKQIVDDNCYVNIYEDSAVWQSTTYGKVVIDGSDYLFDKSSEGDEVAVYGSGDNVFMDGKIADELSNGTFTLELSNDTTLYFYTGSAPTQYALTGTLNVSNNSMNNQPYDYGTKCIVGHRGLTMSSDTWGTYTINNKYSRSIAGNGMLTVVGSGHADMTSQDGQSVRYDCSVDGEIDDAGSGTLTFYLPSVYGGTTIVFRAGTYAEDIDASDAVCATYDGQIGATVMGMTMGGDCAVRLKKISAEKVRVVIGSFTVMASVGAFAIDNVGIVRNDDETTALSETAFETTADFSGTQKDVVGTLKDGIVDANGNISFTLAMTKLGSAPYAMDIKFVGSKRGLSF